MTECWTMTLISNGEETLISKGFSTCKEASTLYVKVAVGFVFLGIWRKLIGLVSLMSVHFLQLVTASSLIAALYNLARMFDILNRFVFSEPNMPNGSQSGDGRWPYACEKRRS